ncbi:MAG: carotenoid 1,2-hydratase [Pseudomonadota bacterium]
MDGIDRSNLAVESEGTLVSISSAFGFDRTVPKGGYLWWYIDAVSDDGQNALVIIAFVGSVFSPYYAWRGWSDPDDHCAINVALYGRPSRWAMTERGKRQVHRSPGEFVVGPSQLIVAGEKLIIDITERGAPLPSPMRGRVTVSMLHQSSHAFELDHQGRHTWQPICTSAKVDLEFDAPNLNWSGHGYVDSNFGAEPVTRGFDYWDWSRTPVPGGQTQVRYVTDPVSGDRRDLNVKFNQDGTFEHCEPLPDTNVRATPIWRIKRRTGVLAGTSPMVHRTLEDTPFYSRSVLAYPQGAAGYTVHETLSCRRLRTGIVRAMLPFRMPRWPVGQAERRTVS